MKPKTRRAVAIGIAVFFAYGLLLAAVTGDANAAGDILRAIVTLALIGALGLGAWWIRTQPRRRSAEAVARELGLRFSAGDPFDLIDLPFALLDRPASARGLEMLGKITFESKAFNRAFTVRGEDRRCASAFVDRRMMQWLLALRPDRWGFEIASGTLLCHRSRRFPHGSCSRS